MGFYGLNWIFSTDLVRFQKNPGMMIEDLRRFSIHDLKRLGVLRDGFSGLLNWIEKGEPVASIGLSVRLSGDHPAVMLNYTLTQTGEAVQDLVELRFQKSNLPTPAGGYWIFVCPVTRKPCRVLFFHRGHFVSRKALPHGTLYMSQTISPNFRKFGQIFDCYDTMNELSNHLLKPYGKRSYRGKPTEKTERLIKVEERYGQVMVQWLREQREQ